MGFSLALISLERRATACNPFPGSESPTMKGDTVSFVRPCRVIGIELEAFERDFLLNLSYLHLFFDRPGPVKVSLRANCLQWIFIAVPSI